MHRIDLIKQGFKYDYPLIDDIDRGQFVIRQKDCLAGPTNQFLQRVACLNDILRVQFVKRGGDGYLAGIFGTVRRPFRP